ncbi:hypothetical protein BT69DRAFT_19845 [Atractiella rhizophila]|nr:hypothetical protein BT69DRAFT_19845 [Atractiella rhizophila]
MPRTGPILTACPITCGSQAVSGIESSVSRRPSRPSGTHKLSPSDSDILVTHRFSASNNRRVFSSSFSILVRVSFCSLHCYCNAKTSTISLLHKPKLHSWFCGVRQRRMVRGAIADVRAKLVCFSPAPGYRVVAFRANRKLVSAPKR